MDSEKKVFIVSTESRSGKSLFTLGLMKALAGIVPRVGYMKPIGQPDSQGTDPDARLIREIFGLTEEPGELNPATMADAQADKDRLFEKIFDAYRRLAEGKDIVVIEGTDYTSAISALEFDINAELAHNMAAPVLVVARGDGKTREQIVENLVEVTESLQRAGCRLLGAVVNRYPFAAPAEGEQALKRALEAKGIPLFGVVPPDPLLAAPRVREVARKLNAKIVYQGDALSKVVRDVKVMAMMPENALGYIKDLPGCLLVTPGDRVDNILAAMAAQRSPNYPQYAGLVLTGGLVPGAHFRRLFKGTADSGLTILSVKEDTYVAAVRIAELTGELAADDEEKLERVESLTNHHVDIPRIYKQLGEVVTDTVTPRMFLYRIMEKARSKRQRIALPEGTEPRIVRAAAEALDRELCDVILLGEEDKIQEVARSAGAEISRARLLAPAKVDPKQREDYAETLYQLRKHKSMTREMARDLMLDPVQFATMMVQKGDADGFVSGSTHSTAETLTPVLRIIKTREGIQLASSIFFMCMPDHVLVYGDCALVENPTAEQMADIAITSAETARAFGIEPRVALLSYSTGQSGKGKDVDKVREAARLARERRPDLPIEGPIQYDAAVSAEVARIKLKDSRVAGKATVYIFPDLDAGNTAYKAVQRSANVPAIGPIMQGLRKPANDLSRGATVQDIVYTIAITAIQAQQTEGKYGNSRAEGPPQRQGQ
jgi:phosphate acetyltransferase